MWKNTRIIACKLFGVLKIFTFEEWEEIEVQPVQQQVYYAPPIQPMPQAKPIKQVQQPLETLSVFPAPSNKLSEALE